MGFASISAVAGFYDSTQLLFVYNDPHFARLPNWLQRSAGNLLGTALHSLRARKNYRKTVPGTDGSILIALSLRCIHDSKLKDIRNFSASGRRERGFAERVSHFEKERHREREREKLDLSE